MSERVAIVIPTRNGAETLPALLAGIARGRRRPDEIVAIDSGSTDGTLELLASRGVRSVQIPPAEFDHGGTRNQGIAATSAELVVLLVQDAVPVGERWLEALLSPLLSDATVAGSFARQVPRPGASVVTRRNLACYAATSQEARVSSIDSAERFRRMDPMARYLACLFDNVCSCVRRAVWQSHPFPRARFAEDVEWARDVLLLGHRIAFAPEAVVEHSHERSARYELGRAYLAHARLHALFGLRTIPTLGHLGVAIATTMAHHARWLREEPAPPRELLRALELAVALPLGQYLGARASATGTELLRPRGI